MTDAFPCSGFPEFLAPLPTPREMRSWDQGAVAAGIPEMALMENASREALAVLRQCVGELRGQRTLLFMGGGNNGGDAACLARHLLDAGALPLVLHTRPLGSYKGVAARHLRLARRCGVPFRLLASRGAASGCCWDGVAGPEWRHPQILVDGLLGTGFSGALREPLWRIIEDINSVGASCFVLALDVPSGLDAATGRPCPTAVRAAATVSFQAAKPGLVLPEAAPFVGALHVREIGIPLCVRRELPPSFYLLDERCAAWLPPNPVAAWKNAFGHVLVAGGSPGLTGAPHLAAHAALRAGAGLVSVAAPAALTTEIKGGCADIMTLPLGGSCCWPERLPESFVALLQRSAALAAGPGLGRASSSAAVPALLLELPHRPPTVWDADALYALGGQPELLARLSPEDVLTPHPGEAARLLGVDGAAVQADRPGAARELASRTPATCVLKGAGTLVVQGDGPVGLAPYDVPTLAVAGSGDVLTGCVGALLARGVPALAAASLGVVLHALAGRALLSRYAHRGNTAAEIAQALPRAMTALREARRP